MTDFVSLCLYVACLCVFYLRISYLNVYNPEHSPLASMEDIYADLDNKTPCIFILSTGADPTSMLLRFAKVIEFLQKNVLRSPKATECDSSTPPTAVSAFNFCRSSASALRSPR